MAKTSSVEKAKRREKTVQKYSAKRAALKEIIYDMSKNFEDRMAAVDKLNSLPRDSSRVRLRNRCSMTGRARGYLRKFKLSRICFRDNASKGLIPGVVKASW